jgi:large subunit ribosomal protein L10
MARSDKAAAVAELTEEFRSSSAAVLTEYRGLTVAQLKTLRRSLGESTSYAVVKNTLTKIAAKDAGVEGLDDLLAGPSAIAFVHGDPVDAAKGLRDFAKTNPHLVIKGGYMDGKVLSPSEIAKIADLESRDVLLAKLAGAMKAKTAHAAALFVAPLAQTARLVEALRAKAEQDPSVIGGAGTPAPAAEEPAAEAVDEAPVTDTPEVAAAADETPAEAPADAEATTDEAPAAPEAASAEEETTSKGTEG